MVIVTCKDIARLLGVSEQTAKKMRKTTLEFYKKEINARITLGQVIKANELEE